MSVTGNRGGDGRSLYELSVLSLHFSVNVKLPYKTVDPIKLLHNLTQPTFSTLPVLGTTLCRFLNCQSHKRPKRSANRVASNEQFSNVVMGTTLQRGNPKFIHSEAACSGNFLCWHGWDQIISTWKHRLSRAHKKLWVGGFTWLRIILK